MASPDIKEKRNFLNQSPFNKARVDKFILVMTMPEALRNIDKKYGTETQSKIVSEKLELSVWGSVIPDVSVPKIDVPYSGQVPQVTSFSRPVYSPVTVNFTIDSEFYNWNVIWRWLALLNDPKNSTFDQSNISGIKIPGGGLKDSKKPEFIPKYATEFTLSPLNEYNQIIGNFIFTQAFPVALQGVQFNYQRADEITSGFTFAFNQLFFNIIT